MHPKGDQLLPAAARTAAAAALAVGVLLVAGCQRGGGGDGPIRFEDTTKAAGIHFVHFDSRRGSLLPEDVGSGAAWGDYDNDGDDDLFLVNFAGPFLMEPAELEKRPGNRLYRNNGDGTFADATASAGVGRPGWNNACLFLDFEGDGWLDLAISHFEGVILFRNRGDGTFEDVTERSGLASLRRFSMGLTAADYDRDGDLDLYVCGYVEFDREKAKKRPLVAGRPAVWTNPVSHSAEPNTLFRNNGDGTFTDTTAAAGVANPNGKSMMAMFADLDNDGWPDLYVANDVSTADALYWNLGNGSFTNVAGPAGTLDYRAGMGLAAADLWHRGWLDLFVTHWVSEDHALWRNITTNLTGHPGPLFEDVTPLMGPGPKPSAHVGWGCGLFDFDNDTYPDLLIVNGSTIEDELTRDVLTNPKLLPQVAQVFRWDTATNRLVELGPSAGRFFGQHHVSRGAAFSDYDNDGRVDVVVVQHGEPAQLLRNTSPAGSWIKVRAAGAGKNTFAVGARVSVHAAGRTQSREVLSGTSYLGNDSYTVHFGLGAAAKADWVEVRFPGGAVRRTNEVTAGLKLVIKQ